jgi:hypothetical protein
VITTDTQVLLRHDGLDVVALPQTWGRLPPYLRGPRRTATEPDVFEKEEHSHDRRPRRPDRRRARPPRFAPVQLLFGYFGISQQAADHDYDAISSLGCGAW